MIPLLLLACGDKSEDTPESSTSDLTADWEADADTDTDTDTDTDADTDTDTDADLKITGDCGVLTKGSLFDGAAALWENALTLPGKPDKSDLSAGGLEILTEGNLGGSSIYSEIYAFEVLYACEGAALLKTEGEIEYDDSSGKKTDLLVDLFGQPVGVSVTRAYHYPPDDDYTVEEATTLLEGKLSDILISADNAADSDEWVRSMLHIIAYNSQYAESVVSAWEDLDETVRDETIIFLTVSEGEDGFLY